MLLSAPGRFSRSIQAVYLRLNLRDSPSFGVRGLASCCGPPGHGGILQWRICRSAGIWGSVVWSSRKPPTL